MIKNVLSEEINRINNIIHGNKLLTESNIGANIIKDAITKSIKSVIDEVISRTIRQELLTNTKAELVLAIKSGAIDSVYNSIKKVDGDVLDDIVNKSIKTLKDEGYDNIEKNTIKVQISKELENSAAEIKTSLKKEVDAARTKLKNIETKAPIDNTKPKKTRGEWFKSKSKTQLPLDDIKPNSKPSDLGVDATPEMKAEIDALDSSLTEESKKTLLDYFRKGGKATYEGLKKLGRIGFLNKTTGKVNRKKLFVWATVLGTTGTLYAIGRWMGDNPETIEDDNLIDDGGSDDNKTTSDDNKTTTDDNKPTINKPTDGKPTDGKPTGGGTTGGGTTGGGNTYDTEYDMPGYNAVDLDWNKLKM